MKARWLIPALILLISATWLTLRTVDQARLDPLPLLSISPQGEIALTRLDLESTISLRHTITHSPLHASPQLLIRRPGKNYQALIQIGTNFQLISIVPAGIDTFEIKTANP